MTLEDRIIASLYGMATGDALGVPSSFLTPGEIKATWGWIDTFHPPKPGHIFHDGLSAGEVTDDTEQALALINAFEKTGKVNPYDIVEEILKWADRVQGKYVSPLDPSTERALKAIRAGSDIHESGRLGNTNGSAMRIAPVGLIHGQLDTSMEALVADVYQTCIPTHNTTVCVASAAAIAAAVCYALRGYSINEIVNEAAAASEIGKQYGYPIASANIAKKIQFAVSLVEGKSDRKAALSELYDYFGGGDLAQDSIPIALALFVLGDGNVKDVNELAVNLGGDCDTNAAMAGAIAGAYSGMATVPNEWIETVERVNSIDMQRYQQKLIKIASRWSISEEGPQL